MIPRPIALGLTICDRVIVEEHTRNVTLVNCYNKLNVEGFPSPPRRIDLYAVLTDGLGDGTINVVVTHLDTDAEVYSFQGRVRFPDRRQELRLYFRIRKCSFPVEGRYQVTVLIDGEWIVHRELLVVAREEES